MSGRVSLALVFVLAVSSFAFVTGPVGCSGTSSGSLVNSAARDAGRAAQRYSITHKRIHDTAEFVQAWESASSSGDHDKMVALALNAYLNLETDPATAETWCALICHESGKREDADSPTGYIPSGMTSETLRRFKADPFIARSYVGGRYEDGYNLQDPENLTIKVDEKRTESDDRIKIWVVSSGKDFTSPMTLARKREGRPWLIDEMSSISTGVKDID